ncbi:hypothetical protein BV22DRAFT_1129302 [Leucogyrophana mollusca]|uniref:Uncharacterized protein n=1 Tax=Leucogyrophana mollusca TaxID=85980 RepID=A0ACB8BII1_9AGAM|nr:hypothetical protein BV22DRAFT_1129302 [Leucogyrophana mollusca]
MDQVLKNIDTTVVPPTGCQPGDGVMEDHGLGSKVAALSAMVTGQQTIIAELVLQVSGERSATNSCREKIKALSARVKANEKEYEVFRGNLLTELIGQETYKQRQEKAFAVFRQETAQTISAYEAEVTDLKLSLSCERAARMLLEATVQCVEDAQHAEQQHVCPITERHAKPASTASEDIKVISPCRDDKENVASRTGSVLKRTASTVSTSSTLVGKTEQGPKKVITKTPPATKPARIPTATNRLRKPVLTVVSNRFSKGAIGPVSSTSKSAASGKAVKKAVPAAHGTKTAAATTGARKSLLPPTSKVLSKAVKHVKSPASTAGNDLESAPVTEPAVISVSVPPQKVSKRRARATGGLVPSSSLEALDRAMAQFNGDSLTAVQAPFRTTPRLIIDAPLILPSMRCYDYRGPSIYVSPTRN